MVLAPSKVGNSAGLKRARREASDWALPRLQDEFGYARGRFHHKQATTTAPRTVRCQSRSVPSEPSSPTPAHDSTPASLMLAPFVRHTGASYAVDHPGAGNASAWLLRCQQVGRGMQAFRAAAARGCRRHRRGPSPGTDAPRVPDRGGRRGRPRTPGEPAAPVEPAGGKRPGAADALFSRRPEGERCAGKVEELCQAAGILVGSFPPCRKDRSAHPVRRAGAREAPRPTPGTGGVRTAGSFHPRGAADE